MIIAGAILKSANEFLFARSMSMRSRRFFLKLAVIISAAFGVFATALGLTSQDARMKTA